MEAQPRAGIELGKRPKIRKGEHRDLRHHTTVPLRALTDPRMTHAPLKILGLLCSYANRAGLLWVGQKRLADQLKISVQAVNKQVTKLKRWGYLETVYKGYKYEKADTLRVIYDPNISTADAVALASSVEDCRAPRMIARDNYIAQFESEGTMPKRKRNLTEQRVSKPTAVEETLKLTIEEVLAQNDVVTEADMLALERAIEAGLSRSRWLEGRAALPEASLRQVLAWCNGSNERMPANTSESKG